MGCSPPGSYVYGILQARILDGLPCPFPGNLPNPGIKPRSLALQADSLPSGPPGKPNLLTVGNNCVIHGNQGGLTSKPRVSERLGIQTRVRMGGSKQVALQTEAQGKRADQVCSLGYQGSLQPVSAVSPVSHSCPLVSW